MELLSSSLLTFAVVAALAICGQLVYAEKLAIRHTTPKGEEYSGYVYDWPLSGPVAALKDKLIEDYGVPRDTLHVVWKGNELQDSFDLSECEGATIDELHLVLNFYQIKLVKPDGGVVFLAGETGDTIAILKDKIARREKIARGQQCLKLASKELNDNELFEKYVAASGEYFALNLALKPGQVRVRLPSGELITFEFGPTEQLVSLKDKIQAEKGMAKERQGLYMNARELPDDEILTNCAGLSGNALTLILIERPPVHDLHLQEIQVRLETNRLVTFEVDPADTVASLKSKISVAEGIAQDKQHLYRALHELADNKLLGDCLPLGHKPVVDLVSCPSTSGAGASEQGNKHVHVKSERNLEEVFVIAESDTVASLKSIIRQKKNMPQDQQMHIFFGQTELADDAQVVEHVQENGSLLYLVAPKNGGPEVVYIKLPSGRLVTYEIAPSSSVLKLKEYIGRERGIGIEKQRLFFGQYELANASRLDAYQIVSGSTLSLLLVQYYQITREQDRGCTVM